MEKRRMYIRIVEPKEEGRGVVRLSSVGADKGSSELAKGREPEYDDGKSFSENEERPDPGRDTTRGTRSVGKLRVAFRVLQTEVYARKQEGMRVRSRCSFCRAFSSSGLLLLYSYSYSAHFPTSMLPIFYDHPDEAPSLLSSPPLDKAANALGSLGKLYSALEFLDTGCICEVFDTNDDVEAGGGGGGGGGGVGWEEQATCRAEQKMASEE
ncbi:hypothetical protein V5O48_017886 [Marasmius crinis-equi]|uniref:Uncharacterized protein n=1 Tax=Marasmius crinis-equi TaxID=585013 RepID=A0ABR3EMQ5_9AGAR